MYPRESFVTTRYVTIVAHPYLCVAALLETILKSEGYEQPDQLAIAEYFGVYLPPGVKLPVRNVHYVNDDGKWGVVVHDEDLNRFFAVHGVSLREEYVPIARLADWEFEAQLRKAISNGHHVICGFSYNRLYGAADKALGHVSLVLELTERESVVLLDPGPDCPGPRQVDLVDLYSAIHAKPDGLWIVKPEG